MAIEDRMRGRAAELGFFKVGFTTMGDLPRASEKARVAVLSRAGWSSRVE